MAEPEKCEITCLECQTAFSVNDGDDEINFRCPVCALTERLSKAEKLLKRILDPAGHPPEPFYDTLMDISRFPSPPEEGTDLSP